MGTTGRLRPAGVIGLAAGTSLLLSSCGLTTLSLTSTGAAAPQSSAHITVAPALGTAAASPAAPVVVKVASGRITDIAVHNAAGRSLKGVLSPDGRSWQSSVDNLGYGATYQVAVTAIDREGLTTKASDTIKTLVPEQTAHSYITPVQGDVVGVGMPITVQFDHKVTDKAAVEKRLKVITATPIVGSWSWIDSKLVEYRPQTFWPANTTIVVKVPTVGTQMAPGVWGDQDRTVSFRTGDAMVSKVDINAHQLTVVKNGKVIRVIPVTTGKPGFDTRSGIKVIMSKELSRIMDASTGGTSKGDPEYYRLRVEFAMRLTWSGEFLHAAPWSVGAQGNSNVSHGCTGMSTDNASWLYGISRPGDVVIYTGSNRHMTLDNGIGEWTVPWTQWKAGSALANA